EAELRRLLTTLADMGVEFVNLNELEYSETNAANLDERGYHVAPGTGWGVDGSKAVAERIVRELRLPMPIHYCSSRFKDGVQLRQRLIRRAERTGPMFADFTDEGTVVFGIVEVPKGRDLLRTARSIARTARVRRPAYRVDERRRRVELGSADLRRVAEGLEFPAFEVEEYPTADALEVEREPLNRAAFPRTDGGV
ncbi:MAG: radical SAM protein, partial [Thermoplasmata archaeon]|nr:radical SAM protein [Thermoplasmata archaeon]